MPAHSSSPSALRSRASRRGFALIITIALLGFVVLLLVGLATYTRIETAIVGNTQRQAQARQNALLALDVALGQLQKHAGPDQRATATGESFGDAANPHYTGVWSSAAPGTAALTWLVSGSEATANASVLPQQLIGPQTAGANNPADHVTAPLVDLTSVGVPGQTGAATIGRYAWWIGDQGVKAPVGLGDTTASLAYSPYDSTEIRSRLRQQISLGAGPATFEPRDAGNASLVKNLIATNQLAFLKTSAGAPVGLAALQQNFHAWSHNNWAVLSNSRLGGLRQDLSVKPDLLGRAFVAWANYEPRNGGAMEAPESPVAGTARIPGIAPAYPVEFPREAQRRRYRLREPVSDQGIVSGISPVLALCLLNFDSRTLGGATGLANIETRLRWTVALWNPYSSAFVPENLRLEITGLPPVLEFAADASGPTIASIPLASATMFGPVLRLKLPWDASRTGLRNKFDTASWLPGRVYYWTSLANTGEPGGGNDGYFYWKNLIGSPSHVVSRVSASSIIGSTRGGWRVTQKTQLTCRLYRENGNDPLATFTSPEFPRFFATDPVASPTAANGGYEFSFVFRLDQNRAAADSVWLTTENRDPRNVALPADAYQTGSQGLGPQNYPDVPALANEDFLLERSMSDSGRSYNEDAPIFELPRSPLLSVGSLQHLHLAGRRPFTIGSPAGATGGWNDLFDRYFFSGLVAGGALPDLAKNEPLPNPLLSVIRHRKEGKPVTSALLVEEPNGVTSRDLLQSGAFNLNSVNRAAWKAVLRSARIQTGLAFNYVDATTAEGSGNDAPPLAPLIGAGRATFYRFPQSAGEVFKADAGKAGGVPDNFNPTPSTVANTHLFRNGVITLTDAQLDELVSAVTDKIKNHHRVSGPFRSTADFLNEGILQAAIDQTSINDDASTVSGKREFSSQFLTQGDIMTALAPVLFPRSDTFVVRAYGEVVNPATSVTEGRAWCEAVVQRVPEYFDPSDDATTATADLSSLNKIHGRRFKIISFRWLTRSDI